MNCRKGYWVFLVVFTIVLLIGLNARAFGNQILSVLWKFWYSEWHLNGNKLCYACLMHCLICQTIRFFCEVNDTVYYPFFPILHILFILLVRSMLLVVVSFWYYDIVSMLQKLVKSWCQSDGLSLVAMFICMCLNLLFTFFDLFLSLLSFKVFIFAIPVICQVTFSSVSHGWLLFFVFPPGFWTAFMPYWSWSCWLICKENCRSNDHKRMKKVCTWNPV